MAIVEHARPNANPKFTINNNKRDLLIPDYLHKRVLLRSVNNVFFPKQGPDTLPGAVIDVTHAPPPSEDFPSPLCDVASEISSKKEEKT